MKYIFIITYSIISFTKEITTCSKYHNDWPNYNYVNSVNIQECKIPHERLIRRSRDTIIIFKTRNDAFDFIDTMFYKNKIHCKIDSAIFKK